MDTPFRSRDPLLTPKEVSEELRVCDRVVLRLCATGKLPGAFRTGVRRGVWRIPRSGLEAYVRSQQEAHANAAPRPAAKTSKRKAKA